jgi:hypothetical protein
LRGRKVRVVLDLPPLPLRERIGERELVIRSTNVSPQRHSPSPFGEEGRVAISTIAMQNMGFTALVDLSKIVKIDRKPI